MRNHVESIAQTYQMGKEDAANEIICMAEFHNLTDNFDFEAYEEAQDKPVLVESFLKTVAEDCVTDLMADVCEMLDERVRYAEEQGRVNVYIDGWDESIDAGALMAL